MILDVQVRVCDWGPFPGHFPLLQCDSTSRWKEHQTITLHSVIIAATQIWILYHRRQAEFLSWATYKTKLDKFFRNVKGPCESHQTCLTCSPGTWVVVLVIEYLQLLHTKWGMLLHYSVCLFSDVCCGVCSHCQLIANLSFHFGKSLDCLISMLVYFWITYKTLLLHAVRYIIFFVPKQITFLF